MKMKHLSREIVEKNYGVHKGKPFYAPLLEFMTSGPVVLIVVKGKDAINVVRKMLGATNSSEALPGTIRGDYGLSNRYNLVHGSDSLDSAAKEISVFFTDDEIIEVLNIDSDLIVANVDGDIV